jgi:hypothetical protein
MNISIFPDVLDAWKKLDPIAPLEENLVVANRHEHYLYFN